MRPRYVATCSNHHIVPAWSHHVFFTTERCSKVASWLNNNVTVVNYIFHDTIVTLLELTMAIHETLVLYVRQFTKLGLYGVAMPVWLDVKGLLFLQLLFKHHLPSTNH